MNTFPRVVSPAVVGNAHCIQLIDTGLQQIRTHFPNGAMD